MNLIIINRLFYSMDYSEYDSPAYLRKHGSVFRQKFWKPLNKPRKSRFSQVNSKDIQ